MTGNRRPPSLRREIVIWYSVVLLIALTAVTGLTFLLLRGALERSVRTSLEQSAETVERLYLPPGIPRLGTTQDIVRIEEEDAQLIRRRTVLITGDTVTSWVVRSDDAENDALRLFLLISMLLIPLTAVAAAIGGRALLDWLLAPLERLVSSTREIGIGALSRRVEEPTEAAELHDLARAYNEMLSRLERAVEALTRFTADASHELRTPLTAIRGSIQVALARERTTAELEGTLAEVLEETEWMLHLVDGLLTLARGDEGGDLIGQPVVDLEPLLRDVLEVGQALAADKSLELTLKVAGPLEVRGSAAALRQVFLNLISNAVKYTEIGRISIDARHLSSAPADAPHEDGAWVEVRVADSGVGIAGEELERVFDRFYRGDAARARSAGAGLGLAIARLISERHGGTIEVTSKAGVGSEFRVLLPAASPESNPALQLSGDAAVRSSG